MTYRILDLFCGAGGAGVGYNRADFEVVGIDNMHQPRYPFQFIQDDALRVLEDLTETGCYELPPAQRNGPLGRCMHLSDFDAIHASPPCQAWSLLSNCRPGLAETYLKLIEPTRVLLKATGLPYVLENVPGSPLRDPTVLCGTMFGLFTDDPVSVELQRHRLFETNWDLPQLICNHTTRRTIPVYGHGAPGNRPDLRGLNVEDIKRQLMCIDWMNRDELNEAIPPPFTQYVGRQLCRYIEGTRSTRNREAA